MHSLEFYKAKKKELQLTNDKVSEIRKKVQKSTKKRLKTSIFSSFSAFMVWTKGLESDPGVLDFG